MRKTHPVKSTIILLFVSSIIACPAAVRGNVTVKREPPVVEYKVFDPADPPKEMPVLKKGEDAVTETVFRCLVNASYKVGNRSARPGNSSATVTVAGLQLTLRLRVVIYLPKNAPEKLKAHEEGHRRVAEQIYKERAEKAAREFAAKADGGQFSGEGIDVAAATKAATQAAIEPVAKGYLKLTGDVSARVGDIYDAITAHGVNKIPEDDAIKQAFKDYEKELADNPAPAAAGPGAAD
ncbi:MAG: hypothetical protein JWN51_1405 [Phycisphaerales bacterium]|nr:hypothetical protein [Phycisphaerales bacterium]